MNREEQPVLNLTKMMIVRSLTFWTKEMKKLRFLPKVKNVRTIKVIDQLLFIII